jgi:hypothetical protein
MRQGIQTGENGTLCRACDGTSGDASSVFELHWRRSSPVYVTTWPAKWVSFGLFVVLRSTWRIKESKSMPFCRPLPMTPGTKHVPDEFKRAPCGNYKPSSVSRSREIYRNPYPSRQMMTPHLLQGGHSLSMAAEDNLTRSRSPHSRLALQCLDCRDCADPRPHRRIDVN